MGGVLFVLLLVLTQSIHAQELAQVSTYVHVFDFAIENTSISCWLPDVSKCDACFVLGGVCDTSKKEPIFSVPVVRGSKNAAFPVGFQEVWSIASEISLWHIICPDGYSAMGDIPIKGLQPPNLEKFKCIANEKQAKPDCELFYLQNSSGESFVMITRLSNFLFLATSQKGEMRQPKCQNERPEKESKTEDGNKKEKEGGYKGIEEETGKRKQDEGKSKEKEMQSKEQEIQKLEKTKKEKVKSKRDDPCNNHGTLDQGACVCVLPYAGPNCTFCKTQGTYWYSSYTPEICEGYSGASITLNVTKAEDVAPFLYSIDGGPKQESPTFSNISADTHLLVAYGLGGECIIPALAGNFAVLEVGFNPTLLVNPDIQVHYACGIGLYAVVTINDTHRSAPFAYSVNGTDFSQNNTIKGLTRGEYELKIKDGYDCVQTFTFNAFAPEDPNGLTAIAHYHPSLCYIPNTGYVTVEASGSGFFDYSVDGSHYQANNTFLSPASGNYTYFVKNDTMCEVATNIVEIILPPILIVNFTISNYNCTGYQITMIATGGTGEITFHINGLDYKTPDAKLQLHLDTPPTDLTYSVRDANGCWNNNTFQLPLPYSPIPAVCNYTQPLCNGGNFSIWASAQVTGDFLYSINGVTYTTDQEFIVSHGGNYTVYVKDSTQCVSTASCLLYDVPAIMGTYSSSLPTNCTTTDGSLQLYASGGTNPYLYSLNGVDFGLSPSFNGLGAGSYKYTIKDKNNCTYHGNVTLRSPDELYLQVDVKSPEIPVNNAALLNYTDISAYIICNASGGSKTYTSYFLGTQQTNLPSFAVSVGEYNVSVQDSVGCKFTVFGVTVSQYRASYCGDQICQSSESCSTCYQDCQVCNISALQIVPLSGLDSTSSILVTWQISTNTSYFYVYKITLFPADLSYTRSFTTSNTSFLFQNLEHGQTYYIKVSAVITDGLSTLATGEFSSPVNWTLSGPASPPQLFAQQHGRDYLLISWNIPFDGRLAITGYTIKIFNASYVQKDDTNTTSLFYSGLKPNSTYSFYAWTQNAYFSSENASYFNFSTDPETCGDLYCARGAGENCSNCFFDCGACTYPTCKGTPECSGTAKGTCVQGVCECIGSWSGPDCSIDGTVPINIGGNGNSSEVIITPSLPSQSVTFNIAVKTIQELDGYGNISKSFELKNYDAVKKLENYTLEENTITVKTTYNISLPNNAILLISLVTFAKASVYPFAGRNISVPDNSVKYSIIVQKWPFNTIRNRLQLVIQTDGLSTNQNACKNTELSLDSSKNVQWFKLNIDDVSLYATFVEDTVADGKPGKASFDLSQTDILLSVPSFWTQIEIDPVYSVLIDPNSKTACGIVSARKHSSTSSKVIGGVVGAVLGVAVVTAVSYFIYKKHQKKKNRQLLSKMYPSDSQSHLTSESSPTTKGKSTKRKREISKLKDSGSTEMDTFEVEKVNGMEVNTSAGRFEVKF